MLQVKALDSLDLHTLISPESFMLVKSYMVVKDNALAKGIVVLQVCFPGPRQFNGKNRIWYSGPDLMCYFIKVCCC